MSNPGKLRSYDASRRREQAQRTHAQIISAAKRLFLTHGYAATSISAIAVEAEASVESVYKMLGGKPRLVKAVFDADLAGEGALPSDEVARQLSMDERDPYARLRCFGSLVAAIGPHVTPLALLVRDAAAINSELAEVWEQLSEERLERMTVHAERLWNDGHLRSDISVQDARDVLWSFASPEFYDLLVLRRGWDAAKYGCWIGEAYVDALLPKRDFPLSD